MTTPALKIEVAASDFFSIPLKRVEIETVRETGRTYFLFKGRIVAVARRSTTHRRSKMGACEFTQRGKGKDAAKAFDAAREQALYDYGHAGYTGSLAEKHSFVLIPVPDGLDPAAFAAKLMETDDKRISDKWGPAECVQLAPGDYLFFGLASS